MIDIPNPDSSFEVADWVELFVAIKEDLISKAKLSHLIEKASGQEPKESFICDVWGELKTREKRYENSPFTIDQFAIESKNDFSFKNAYITCLIISLFGAGEKTKNATKLFERLTCAAAKSYLKGEAMVFGWPVPPEQNPSIRDRIIELSSRLNERYVESPPVKYKDRGVDVIAWKPFQEKRSSQLVMLLQCSAGGNWRSKTGDLPLDAWEQYIHWSFNPVKAFAVPHIISDNDWHEISKEGGILFDRIRIINLISEIPCIDKVLSNDIDSFVNNLDDLN